jgi:hypothetical protein
VADISFVPTFHHVEFVDDDGQVANPDRVRADEPNGFNDRFHDIETDLATLSTVVSSIDTAIKQHGTPNATLHLTLPPSLVAINLGSNWTITATGAAQSITAADVAGLLEVTVPPGMTFVSLRAVGTNGGAGRPAVTVTLSRVAIASAGVDTIAQIVAGSGPFDQTQQATASLAGPTSDQFRYVITASAPAATSPTNLAILSMFQLVLVPA